MTTAMATAARSIGCRARAMERTSTARTAMKMAKATPRRSIDADVEQRPVGVGAAVDGGQHEVGGEQDPGAQDGA